ncbi:MAG: SAM-dependent methyltransferase [Desulfurococcales archaeon]|nr:SAM-dependent methyltransferase [Desulfurococcales archaeon]
MGSRGRVYIVGGGVEAGDITLDGYRALSEASVIVYDRLIDSSLLDQFRDSGVKLIYAGKRPGSHTLSQDEINNLLLQYALKGEVVARLKGGDPMLYGRGEEECLYLRGRGIECTVIPGVTSASKLAAKLGLPLAGRCSGSVLSIATGVKAGGKPIGESEVRRLIEYSDTVIFYMATGIYRVILEALQASGRRDTAVLIVEDLGGRERYVYGRAGELAGSSYEPSPPALIVVGGGVEWWMKHRRDLGYSS